MPKLFASLLLLATASTSFAQASSLRPADPAQIAAGVTACAAAARPGAIDQAALTRAGWKQGTMRDSQGKELEAPVDFYGRTDSNVILMTMPSGPSGGGCTVSARIESTDAAPRVVDALSAELKAQPKRIKNNDLVWLVGRTFVQLSPTGDRAKPALRITVLQLAEKK